MAPMSIAPPLREVAELKIDHFNQLKEDFKARYGIGAPAPPSVNLFERIATLIKTIRKFDPYLEEDGDLTEIAHHVEDVRDSCISHEKLVNLEERIVSKLHKQLSRYETTSLHLDLMKEAMDSKQPERSQSSALNAMSLEDDFEVVEDRLEASWEKFEAEAFTAKDVDVDALEAYLAGLMNSTFQLKCLRRGMSRYGDEILEGESRIEEDELEWCIMDLLHNDLISDEKKRTLEGYIQNPVTIKELLGVLNMKSISQWDWKRTSKGTPVTARQDLQGQYHITVEEDLVDALYLHCMAIGWAQKLKGCLSDYIRHTGLSYMRTLSSADSQERKHYLDMSICEPPPPPESHPDVSGYLPPAPPPQLLPIPPPPPPGGLPPPGTWIAPPPPKSGNRKNINRAYAGPVCVVPAPPPPPPPFTMGMPPMPLFSETMDEEKHMVYRRDFFMSRLPTEDGCRPRLVPSEEVQANLVKTLAADIKLRAAFGDLPANSVADFHSLATALPHKTVLTILKFLGFPEVFTDFFTRYLAVDLNIGPSARGTRDRILTRACGVPERHGLGLLFTEAVMFFAELAILREIKLPLYRLGSRCYFVGTEEQCDAVSQQLAIFSEHTKLDFDDVSVQPDRLHIGFLEFAADTVTIKQSAVEAYARQVKRQLSSQTTVYDWVHVWNKSMGAYAAHLFGPLVDMFGQSHLLSVKAAYQEMIDIIFDHGPGLTHHVRGMLCARSDYARTIPPLTLEAIIYLPQKFGGLGVRNPLIALNLARDISPDPDATVREYLDSETSYYETALKNWSSPVSEDISEKCTTVFPDSNNQAIANGKTCSTESGPVAFITKESLTRHREYAIYPGLPRILQYKNDPVPFFCSLPPHLLHLYQALLKEPVSNVVASGRIKDNIREYGPCKRWEKLSAETCWILMMYGDECFERYGGLEVWCERYVPTICMALARGMERLADEDGSSYSYSV